MELSPDAQDFTWLLTAFVDRVPGVTHAVVVSSDGLPVALSRHIPRQAGDQLAAIAASLCSMVTSAARLFEGRGVRQTVVEMHRGYFVVMSMRDGSVLAVLAARGSEVGMVGYEMARLVKQAGSMLTPALRSELQGVLAS